jgi:hypothetical protein
MVLIVKYVRICIYIYIYIYTCICIYVYIYYMYTWMKWLSDSWLISIWAYTTQCGGGWGRQLHPNGMYQWWVLDYSDWGKYPKIEFTRIARPIQINNIYSNDSCQSMLLVKNIQKKERFRKYTPNHPVIWPYFITLW